MGFLGNGAVGHGAGFKPLDDLTGGLHFIQGNAAVFGKAEFQQAPQGVGSAFVIHQVCIFPELLIGAGLYRLPQGHNGLGIVHMVLGTAAGTQLVGSRGIQRGVYPQVQQVKGMVMPPLYALADFLQPNALHRAYRAGEIGVDYVLANTDGLEDLSRLVGLQGGNAHFRCNFDDPMEDGVIVVVNGLVGILVQPVLFYQLRHAFLGEIGVDGPCTVAKKGCKMVNISGLCGFQDDGNRRPLLRPNQVLFHGGYGKQRGDCHMVFVHASVGKDDHIGPIPIGPVTLDEQPVYGVFQRGIFIVQKTDRFHLETGALHVPNLHQLQRGEDGILDFQHPAVFRPFVQQVTIGADIYGGIRDNFLPHGVNGRIGHLGKELLEVVEKGLMLFGQHCQWNIRSHGGNLLRAGFCHGQHGIVDVLIGVAESLVELFPLLRRVHGDLAVGHRQLLQGDKVLVQPFAVGLPLGKGGLAFLVRNDLFPDGIHQQHPARLQTGLADNILLRNIQHAHFRGDNQPPVFGDIVPGRAQAVPVQHGAHDVAIREENGRGAVPGLHHGGVVVVKVPFLPGHAGIVAPGLRNGDHYG